MAYKVFLGDEIVVWPERKPHVGMIVEVPLDKRAAANSATRVRVTEIVRYQPSGPNHVYWCNFEPWTLRGEPGR